MVTTLKREVGNSKGRLSTEVEEAECSDAYHHHHQDVADRRALRSSYRSVKSRISGTQLCSFFALFNLEFN